MELYNNQQIIIYKKRLNAIHRLIKLLNITYYIEYLVFNNSSNYIPLLFSLELDQIIKYIKDFSAKTSIQGGYVG